MRKTWLGTAMVVLALISVQARQARANDYLTFAGGPMKNLYVDLIFWGNNFQESDRQRVKDNVTSVAQWLNGAQSGPGLEPAAHWYGVSGITPGMWLNDTNPTPPTASPPFSGQFDDVSFRPVVTGAQSGSFGPAMDFSGNVASPSGLPADANRLAFVITKGTNKYCISTVSTTGCEVSTGYHYAMSGRPYGAIMLEGSALSHEIMEAMTDPYPFSGWHGGGFSPSEAADECSGSPFAPLTVNPAFVGPSGSVGQTTCQMVVPEQHAPMAAAVEYSSGVQRIFLYYIASNGHVNRLQWNGAGQAASSPFDAGQPSSTVRAVGKPALAFLQGVGEYLFVKGSDNAVWMRHNDVWTSLGGRIYGDPSAHFWLWNNEYWVHVAAVGTDDRLYVNGIKDGASAFGWGQVPSGGTLFVGSPTIANRAVNALDIFAPAEDGSLKWVAFQDASGWAAPVTISAAGNGPYLAAPSVVTLGVSNAAVFGVTQFGLYETSWSGSGWYSMMNSPFQLNSPDSYSGFQGTPVAVSSGTARYDMFSVSRNGKLFWWYSNNQTAYYNTWADGADVSQWSDPLVSAGVSGDPVAVARTVGEVEVFYRTTNGALTHMTYNTGGAWTTEKAFGSIGAATVYDPPSPNVGVTVCSPGGQVMHCCPSGYAMVGANPNTNVFKCAPIDNATGPITLDTGTVRNNMHVCPSGQVMVGLHVAQNLLACQALPPNTVTAERVDSTTQDSLPMRTCDAGTPTGAMSGIRVDQNLLSCVSVTQIQ